MSNHIYYSLIFCVLQNAAGAAEVVVCEGDSMLLSCNSHQVITIIEANFGRESPVACTIGQNITATCQSTSALAVMQSACDNKQYCSVMASKDTFGDQCPGVTRYLCVLFLCVDEDSTSTITSELAVETTTMNSESTFTFTRSMPNKPVNIVSTASTTKRMPSTSNKPVNNASTASSTKRTPSTTNKPVIRLSTESTTKLTSNTTNRATKGNVLDVSTTDAVNSKDSSSATIYDNVVKTCTCRCNIRDVTKYYNTVKQLPVSNFTKTLAVNKTNLSANKRKLTSALDRRVSATIVGYTGVIVLVLILVILFVFDFVNHIKKRN